MGKTILRILLVISHDNTAAERSLSSYPRDRYPTARAMLDTLQSIANPIPLTQPLLTGQFAFS
ncbi:hypothetical protein [Nostoc sp. CHAB 5715]|uniref:hypothetical protein n=1 Tax=Nostoc sp. CHAB 5715 TaxID=2780400 RepID=UPI001E30AE25|nr:hypothetical protein [Nostoc sp. CHAB 5715]MCC5623727.1 hypothetical protein [Nostoc sp. CHAB 5715]